MEKNEHYMCTLVVECVQHRSRVFAPVYAVVAGTRLGTVGELKEALGDMEM